MAEEGWEVKVGYRRELKYCTTADKEILISKKKAMFTIYFAVFCMYLTA